MYLIFIYTPQWRHMDQGCGAGARSPEPRSPGAPEPAIFGVAGAMTAFKIYLEPEQEVNLAAPAPDLFCALTVAMVRSCCATN